VLCSWCGRRCTRISLRERRKAGCQNGAKPESTQSQPHRYYSETLFIYLSLPNHMVVVETSTEYCQLLQV
jgi:hypothetical protein